MTKTQLQLDKVSRDKVSLLAELESLKEDVSGVDRQLYQVGYIVFLPISYITAHSIHGFLKLSSIVCFIYIFNNKIIQM